MPKSCRPLLYLIFLVASVVGCNPPAKTGAGDQPPKNSSPKVDAYQKFVAEFISLNDLATASENQAHFERMDQLWKAYEATAFGSNKVGEVREILRIFEAQIDGKYRGRWYSTVSGDARQLYLFLQSQ